MKYLTLTLTWAIILTYFTCTTESVDLSAIQLLSFEVQVPVNSSLTGKGRSGILETIRFEVSGVKVNWENAMTLCNKAGFSRLLTIPDSTADYYIKTFLQDIGSFSAWTSGNDFSGSFKWATTGASFTYGRWRSGSTPPSGTPGCASVANLAACGRTGGWGWDKSDCASLFYAICERI